MGKVRPLVSLPSRPASFPSRLRSKLTHLPPSRLLLSSPSNTSSRPPTFLSRWTMGGELLGRRSFFSPSRDQRVVRAHSLPTFPFLLPLSIQLPVRSLATLHTLRYSSTPSQPLPLYFYDEPSLSFGEMERTRKASRRREEFERAGSARAIRSVWKKA